MMESGLLTSSEMKKSGLVDTISYIDQYEKTISEFTKSKYRTITCRYRPVKCGGWNREMDISTRVAQVNLSGAIVEQSSGGRRIESKSCLSILKIFAKIIPSKVFCWLSTLLEDQRLSDRIARAIDKLVREKTCCRIYEGCSSKWRLLYMSMFAYYGSANNHHWLNRCCRR